MPVRPRHRLVAASLVSLAAAATAPAGADAAAYPPPPGKVYHGVTGGLNAGDYTSFSSLVGKHQPVWQLFLTWRLDVGGMQYVRVRFQEAARLRTRLMLSLTTANSAGRQMITPAGLARGDGDQYFIGLNREIAASGQITYVRPLGEMNQADNVYSAYSHHGPRGASHSTANFKRAWRRFALILRGGNVAQINARLRSQGMPGLRRSALRSLDASVRTNALVLPSAQVALVWCPQVSGNPGVAGNAARAYWPGAAYVDWVCTDFYSGFPNFAGLNRFYAEFGRRGKPFAFGEYGVYPGGDAPGFMSRLFAWARSHPGVKMMLFNQGNRPGGRFRLQRYPRSASVIRKQLRGARFAEFP